MTAFVIVYPVVLTALLALLMAAIPSLMPPELPLGVRIPTEHRGDAVIVRSVRRFRWAQVVVWVVCAAVTLLLAVVSPVSAAALPVLLFVALSIVSLVISRRSIIRIKREESWFDGVPIRVRADVVAASTHRPPVVWPILGAIVLAIAVAIGVALYPQLPDPLPVHWGAAGQIDGTSPKSIGSVFGALVIAAAVLVLFAGLSIVAARSSVRPILGDDPQQAAARARAQRGILSSLLSELSFVVPFGLSAVVVATWVQPSPPVVLTGVVLLLGLVVLVMVVGVIRIQRVLSWANRRTPASTTPHSPAAPDDDRHWKGGMLYINRDDPAVMVPKRFGTGWTVNFGSPGGAAFGILMVLIVAGATATSIVVAVSR